MSADNAIYIRPMSDGTYRVKELKSFYYDHEPKMTDEEIDAEFATGYRLAKTEDEADEIAEVMIEEIENSGGYVEYGTELLERTP